VLAIAHAGTLLSTGEARGVEARLAAAERWIPASTGPEERATAEARGMVVRHPTALGHLAGAIALYRAALARMQGDVDETIRQARVAHAAADEDQPLERGAAAGILALAQWTGGNLETAHDTWSMAVADLERAGHHADMLGGCLAMAEIRLAQGRLADARRTLERGLRLGTQVSPPLPGTADMHVGLAELDLERNELAAAVSHLDAAAALGDAGGLPQNPWRKRVATAGVRAAEGDFEAAHSLLDEAEAVYDADFFPAIRPIAALRARLWARQGRRADALAWAEERQITADDPLSYLSEYEHITLAQALLAGTAAGAARGDLDAAAGLVDRLLAEAIAGGRVRSVIELTAMRGIIRTAAGDRAGASSSIREAVSLAEPEGFCRLLVDLGPAVAPLLRDAAGRMGAAPFFRGLLAALEGGRTAPTRAQSLVEPLSERELDVLRLLASDLDGPAIASQLFVSLNTMRTHTKNIFAKLGVNSRRAAVARATELGLLPGAR
jgi:LuxR family maltose regulon positive regulatory protein